MEAIMMPVAVLGVTGVLMGLFLAYASKKFEVEVDPKVEAILAILPGVNFKLTSLYRTLLPNWIARLESHGDIFNLVKYPDDKINFYFIDCKNKILWKRI